MNQQFRVQQGDNLSVEQIKMGRVEKFKPVIDLVAQEMWLCGLAEK
jgi:hypothetical protein